LFEAVDHVILLFGFNEGRGVAGFGKFATEMSTANEAAAWACSKTALEMELAAKATTLEHDLQIQKRRLFG
jgi:hypothetical protein